MDFMENELLLKNLFVMVAKVKNLDSGGKAKLEQVLSVGQKADSRPALINVGAGEEKILLVEKIADTKIILKENARLTFVLLALEGWEDVPKLEFEFSGKGAELIFLGFVIGHGEKKYDFETVSRHVSPQTKAHYHLRAAMYDHSSIDYKGNLIIEKSAQLTDTYLAHHTLLLSDHARARTIPALEIEADDVKAGHAATIGKVDKDLMFYLQSRGIEPKEAEQLLISGFFETQLKMIDDQKMQQNLREKIMSSLPTILPTILN